jgi:hypothetical protein
LKGAYPLKADGLSKFKALNAWYKANKSAHDGGSLSGLSHAL